MLNKNILVDNIRAGMIMGKDAVARSGEVIVPKNTVLSARFIARLKAAGIPAINVSIPDYIATPDEKAEYASPAALLKQTQEYKDFRRALLKAAADLSEAFETLMINPGAVINYEDLIISINHLADAHGSTIHVLELLQASRDFDDSIYVHSVGVALLARIIGIKAQFNEQQLHDLILSALLHDIGKITIDEAVLNKTGKLTPDEFEEIKSHTTLGYSLLNQTKLPDFVALSALHHHERYDGSGYPDGLAAQQIPLYARYIAVADVYNAMTSKRSYRDDMCAFDVIKAFENEGMAKYDAGALLPFLNCLAQSQIGAHVLLNNGLEGKIIMLNERLTKPIIKFGDDFIDLSRHADMEIVKII